MTTETPELPIVFPVEPEPTLSVASHGLPEQRDYFGWRVLVRALSGLQKEALAFDPDGRCWRLASDEGVQLGGEEQYPCPLEYLTMGAVFCLQTQLVRLAERHGIRIDSLRVAQDNRYSVDGSALQGTMLSTAYPAAITVHLETGAMVEDVNRLVQTALSSSPAEAYLRQDLGNTFNLHLSGKSVTLPGLRKAAGGLTPQVWQPLAQLAVSPAVAGAEGLVTRQEPMPEGFCVETEVLSEVQIEQRGGIVVHGEGWVAEDGGLEGLVQQCKPVVTGFRCRSSLPRLLGPRPVAPPPLAYLVTGMATCYITQLLRYAHLAKYPLTSAFVVQNNVFRRVGDADTWSRGVLAEPVATHAFLEAEGPDERARQSVIMAERMCFVHAAMRATLPSTVHVWRNGVRVL